MPPPDRRSAFSGPAPVSYTHLNPGRDQYGRSGKNGPHHQADGGKNGGSGRHRLRKARRLCQRRRGSVSYTHLSTGSRYRTTEPKSCTNCSLPRSPSKKPVHWFKISVNFSIESLPSGDPRRQVGGGEAKAPKGRPFGGLLINPWQPTLPGHFLSLIHI